MWIPTTSPSDPPRKAGECPSPGTSNRWSAAILRLTDARVDETDDEITRYPAQWVYVMWKPSASGMPAVWPDGWGLLQQDPRGHVSSCVGSSDWVELAARDCAWSLWLDLLLSCERWDPWQVDLLEARRDAERSEERALLRRLYNDPDPAFKDFLQQLTRTDGVDLDNATDVVRLVDGQGPEQSSVTVAMLRDGALHLHFATLDFGGPRLPDVAYRLPPEAVVMAKLELGLLAGEVFHDATSFVRVVLAQFADLRQGLRWMREAGVWTRHADEDSAGRVDPDPSR